MMINHGIYIRNCLIAILAVTGSAVCAQPSAPMENMKLTHGFIENKGQVVDQNGKSNNAAFYIFPMPGNTVVLRATGFSYDTYATRQRESKNDAESIQKKLMEGERHGAVDNMEQSHHRVDIEFVNANPHPEIIASQQSVDYIMYYTNDVSLQARHYGKVTYRNIYPNIDVEFIARPGQEKQVEYNFIVHPGGDVKQIQLRYDGANASRLAGGKLKLKLAHGNLTEHIPASYWQKSKEHVDIRYRQVSKHKSGITIGFDGEMKTSPDQNLIIDPAVLLDWQYTAGGASGAVVDLTIDEAGNTYITGNTSVAGLATADVFETIYAGGGDGFVAKLNSSGVLQWFTYFGGARSDGGGAITLDATGNIFVTGYTFSTTGLASPFAHKTSLTGTAGVVCDAFLIKFTNSGSRVWGTYYGGTEFENRNGFCDVVTAPDGSCFITGETDSWESIATAGTHKSILDPIADRADAFVAKFNSTGGFQWGTYFGGEKSDGATGIAFIESEGTICLVGATLSTTHISTFATPQYGGGGDGFVAKFNATLGTLNWATYCGGSNDDSFAGVALDNLNNIYAVGLSRSSDGVETSNNQQTMFAGGTDAIVVKYSSNGLKQWGTYYGGTGTDYGTNVAVDNQYATYFSGLTQSSVARGFFAKLNQNGLRDWETYYNNSSLLYGIDTGPNGRIVVGGRGQSPGFSILAGSFSPPCTPPELATLAIQTVPYFCAMRFTAQQIQNCVTTYSWDFGDGTTSQERSPMHSYGAAGTYTVTLHVKTLSCVSTCEGDKTVTQQVNVSDAVNFENITLQVSTDQRDDILSVAASTFSDAWPLDELDPALAARGSFVNGSKGVWRNNATYVYQKPRKLSTPVTLATDGTFVFDRFVWNQAHFNIIPNWIQANTMTRYSPFSYELENEDVLGTYSGAIYDYGGQLQAASGVNMRNGEMAFTSFEFLDQSVAGNWVLATQPLPLYNTYTVNAGNTYIAVVEANMETLSTGVDAIDVMGLGFVSWLPGLPPAPIVPFYVSNEHIVCMRVHPDNPEWTLVVLDKAPFNGTWTGQLRVKHIVTPTVVAVFDSNNPAHSGKKSLKITADQTFKQEVLSLTPGKSYLLNCWASVQNPNVMTPVLAGQPGVEIIARQKNGQAIQTFPFTPGGPLIEGWQQVKGTFVCPANTAYFEIKFKKGTAATAWFDDLRLQPEGGNMKGYVYNVTDLRLQAVLDEENFASYFFYDQEGNLTLTKKETIDGVKTLSESASYAKPTNP